MVSVTRRQFGVWGAAGLGLAAGLARAATPRPGLYLCEGCEAVGERAADGMTSVLDLTSAADPGERMRLTGRVTDPQTGAGVRDVVLYVHHTNAEGLYANGAPDTQWSRRHGRLRGWVKTDAAGVYQVETIKPGPYPDMTMPAHVHVFVGEPGRRPYYIDDVVFAGEYGIDDAYRARQELRGGSGIVPLSRQDGVWIAARDIVLEPHPA